jgi:hypothetical protein
MWQWVGRWRKVESKLDRIKDAADAVRTHWEEVALDQGYDPDKNVTVQESDHEIRVGISEEMDMTFREGPGGWR